MKKSSILASLLILVAPLSLSAAVTLENADSLWLFDGGTVGTNATYSQITDSSANNHQTSSNSVHTSNLSWVAVPATGPSGGETQGSGGHGLKFTPYTITDNPTGSDNVSSAYFVATNASVSGSSTMVTRLRWDGLASNDGANPWLINNGLGGFTDSDGTGPLQGSSMGYLFGLTTGGHLNYYTAGAAAGTQTPSGATHTFNTGSTTGTVAGSSVLALTVGQWYDLAMVIDDLGDSSQTTTRVTFYLAGSDGLLKTYSLTSTNIWGSSASASTLIVGTESTGVIAGTDTGTGTGNNRKTFNGALDYLAMFDTALTQQEVLAIFAVPEPSCAMLLLSGLALIATRRRRKR